MFARTASLMMQSLHLELSSGPLRHLSDHTKAGKLLDSHQSLNNLSLSFFSFQVSCLDSSFLGIYEKEEQVIRASFGDAMLPPFLAKRSLPLHPEFEDVMTFQQQ